MQPITFSEFVNYRIQTAPVRRVSPFSRQVAGVGSIGQQVKIGLNQTGYDLFLWNAKYANVRTGELKEGCIGITRGRIVFLGREIPSSTVARVLIDMEGKTIVPGLIDGHMHVESTMQSPRNLAAAFSRRGTTTIVADPHEIANVLGRAGIDLFLQESRALSTACLDLFLGVPSCVPATPRGLGLETNGATITVNDVANYLERPWVIGLGEVMNAPGVLFKNRELLRMIALTQRAGKVVDGHAPGMTGTDLSAYRLAGIGSDHEISTVAELGERLDLGFFCFVRDGSAAKNFADLASHITGKILENPLYARGIGLATDDIHVHRLLNRGHLDHTIRKAITAGIPPMIALQMATINPANYFGLRDRGRIELGALADLVVVNSLAEFSPLATIYNGWVVSVGDKPNFQLNPFVYPQVALKTVHAHEVSPPDLALNASGGRTAAVIGVTDGSLLTQRIDLPVKVDAGGKIVPDIEKDILKIVVVGRHKSNQGNISVGLVRGIGLKKGAIASSVAHDSHNIIAVGTSDEEIAHAINILIANDGGFSAVCKGNHLSLPLRLAGLMSTEANLAQFDAEFTGMHRFVTEELGSTLKSPFTTLSFMALPVIPELKITDMGLVQGFEIVPLLT